MKPSLTLPGALPLMLLGTLILSAPAIAGEAVHKAVIKVVTDGSELFEADVSELQLGESKSFVTDAGRTVDILRVPEGFELYVDGELIETGATAATADHHLALHEALMDVACDENGVDECETRIEFITEHGDLENIIAHAHDDAVKVIVARHQTEEICDEQGDCDVTVTVDDDVDFDLDADVLHESDREVIVIRKEFHADSN